MPAPRRPRDRPYAEHRFQQVFTCHLRRPDAPFGQTHQAGRWGMILEHILREKGSEVYSIAESATLKEAAELLDSRRVGAMVILGESGAIIGVFSERDLVRAIAKMGAAALTST